MKLKKILPILILISLSLFIAPVVADGVPQLPIQIYGTATTTSGADLPVGTVITATLDDQTFTYTITEAGKIGAEGSFGNKFLVSSTSASGNIVFSANGLTANQSVAYVPGNVQNVALVFDINVPVTSVQITGPVVVGVGKTVTLAADVLPESASNKAVTWSSSNSSVASVTNGVVTGVKEGTATITAASSDGSTKSGNVTISVVAADSVAEPVLPEIEAETNPAGEVVSFTIDNSSIETSNSNSSMQTVMIEENKNGSSSVSIEITNATVETSGSTSTVTLSETSKITATYPETVATVPSTVQSKPSGEVSEEVSLGLTDLSSALPVISSNFNESVASSVKSSTVEPVAMVTGTYNAGVSESDKKVSKVSVTFEVEDGKSWYSNLVSNGKRVVGLHVRDGIVADKQILTPNSDGDFVMTGTSFSSYVFAVETVPASEKQTQPTSPSTTTTPSTSTNTTTNTQTTQNTQTSTPVKDTTQTTSPNTTATPATSTKTTATKSPFPLFGVLAGIGIGAFVLCRRRM